MTYADFLDAKSQTGANSGFAPVWMPDFLFAFQADQTEWSIRKGRAANIADCGLGKTPMGLVWASNVARKTLFQHCAHVVYFPSHSFEQYYQSIRRCWRFGQSRPVTVDIITTEGERGVLANLRRKAEQADEMFSRLVAQMNHALSIERGNNHTKALEVPAWL